MYTVILIQIRLFWNEKSFRREIFQFALFVRPLWGITWRTAHRRRQKDKTTTYLRSSIPLGFKFFFQLLDFGLKKTKVSKKSLKRKHLWPEYFTPNCTLIFKAICRLLRLINTRAKYRIHKSDILQTKPWNRHFTYTVSKRKSNASVE